MDNNLSGNQKAIYDFIKSELNRRGYPPSVREICQAVGLSSTSTVHGHLSRLEKKGFIRRDPTKPRALELLKEKNTTREMIDIPIVGKVTAGAPILAVENAENTFSLPLEFLSFNNDLFMLKVSGNSMIDAGINDGDLAIIEKCTSAKNGEVVVAMIDNEATLKTFYKESSHIRLQPENPMLEPIIVDDCTILGKLKGLFRSY